MLDSMSRILDLVNKDKSLRNNDIYELTWKEGAIHHEVLQEKDEDKCQGVMEPEYIYNNGHVINVHWVCNTCGKSITDSDLYWSLLDQEEENKEGGFDTIAAYEHDQELQNRDYQNQF